MDDSTLTNFSSYFYWSPSPYINRFLSADTIVPGYANPQALNRYSYVLNNPVKLIDPTGHKCVGKEGECEDEDGNQINGVNGPKDIKRDLQRMKRSDKLVDFLKHYEGNPDGTFPDQPYQDMGGTGTCTIGYGHVVPNGKDGCSGEVRKFYRENPLSPQGAMDFLESDITTAENVIKDTVKVDLTQAQFDSLVSYVFNVGKDKLLEKKIPDLLKSGNFQGAASAIESGPITSNDMSSDALVDRRQAEADMFLYGIYLP